MPDSVSPATQRQIAVDTFNFVWTMLNKPDRTREDDDTMLHAAHASRYHWGEVGEPVNFARGEWQVSHVYAVLKRPEPATYHAQRCLAICIAHNIGDFDLAFAYEALARAANVAGDREEALRYLEQARQAGKNIAAEDDRQLFDAGLATILPDKDT